MTSVLLLLFMVACVADAKPVSKMGDSRDLGLPWGGFTPFQRSAHKPGSPPWWGPARMSQAKEYPELRSQLYEGDILLPFEDSRNGIRMKKYLWEGGIIPYTFAPGNFSSNMTAMVHKAMRAIENKTCIRFVEKEEYHSAGHIELRSLPGRGCYAIVGYRPGKTEPLPVNLQYPECFHLIGIIEHELLHVVGLLHEQSREDRDEHVSIHWENIEKDYWNQFSKTVGKEVSTYDLPYDYKSVMHYPTWAFSRNGKSTITAKGHPKMQLGQRKAPSHIDVQKVQRMYNCSGIHHYY